MSLLRRIFRRCLVAVFLTAASTILLVTIALAVKLVPGSTFTGQSKHKHYGITLQPECFSSGCTKVTSVGVQVTIGNPKHPGGTCIYGTFQLGNARLHGGSFSSSGEAFAGARTFKLKVIGKFTSSTRVHGTVFGPKVCGASDTYRLVEKPAAG
jgi:hypothetical protein